MERIMAGKTVPLSVRVSDDDAEFLAGLEISGATTPSEKLRAVLANERNRWERAQDPAEAAEFMRDLLRPAQRRVRKLEAEVHKSSDAVLKLYERLPELTAAAFAGPASDGDGKSLTAFEARLLDQAFALLQEILELGLLSHSRCYDPQAIASRLGPVLELVELMRISQERRKGGL
jgi:hypothetical protein